MQPTDLQVCEIYEDLKEKLSWAWCAGREGGARLFDESIVTQANSSVDLAGYLNFLHPHRISVMGSHEMAYFAKQFDQPNSSSLSDFVLVGPPVLILADGKEAPQRLIDLCEKSVVPLFTTNESAAYVIDVLRAYLAKSFALKVSLHGVFMDIFGLGVLIQGESGLGKSELGLDLISREHGLIADDVVDFSLIAQGVIEGRCPELLKNMLEVRGIGLLNVRTIFGETAMRRSMRLRLVVRLVRREVWDQEFERLPTGTLYQEILGVQIREIVIPVQAGRNIAVLVEAAVRNTILQMQGIDAYQEFIMRQQQEMDKD